MIATPEHTVCDDGVVIALGVGLTNIVAAIGVPGQIIGCWRNRKVTVMGALVVLVNVPLILPDPLAAMPVTATVYPESSYR